MNQIRIIGGEWKRRVVRFEPVDGLRPTPDRIRETLFNWLMWQVSGRHVLDLCAGSGALGLEALSRGAASCIFIEPNPKQAATLQHNLDTLQAGARATVWCQTAQQAHERVQQRNQGNQGIDLLFLDPPYALDLWPSLSALYQNCLSANAWIYVEADRPLDQLGLPEDWQLYRQARAGTVQCGLFQRKSA